MRRTKKKETLLQCKWSKKQLGWKADDYFSTNQFLIPLREAGNVDLRDPQLRIVES